MLYLNKHLYVVLIALLLTAYESEAAWKTLTTPVSDQTITLIAAEDENNLWLSGTDRNIYHCQTGVWETIQPPPVGEQYDLYYSLADATLFGLSISQKTLETSLYTYTDGRWEELKYKANVLVRSIISDNQAGFWGYGDWGTLFHGQGKDIQSISAPISHHIPTGQMFGHDSLWLGTRNEGVFLHTSDGEFYQYFDSTWAGHDVLNLFDVKQDGISLILDDGRVFKIRSDSISIISPFQAPSVLHQISHDLVKEDIYGITTEYELFYLSEDGWEYFPIFPPRPILMIQTGKQGDLFVSGDAGLLLISHEQTGLHFNNFAEVFSIEGSNSANTQGCALVDIEHDGDLDLFIFNTDRYHPSRLYRNYGGRLFSEISFEAGLMDMPRPRLFSLGDFDQEGSLDLAYLYQADKQFKLGILFQITASTLTKHERHINELKIEREPVQLLLTDYDQDSDPDLFIVTRKTNGNYPGNVTVLENRWGHKFSQKESSFQPINNAWFTSLTELGSETNGSIFYSAQSWSKDEVTLVRQEAPSVLLADSMFVTMGKTSSYGVALADYDNDGDMDLFRTSIDHGLEIFASENGQYTNQSGDLLASVDATLLYVYHINLADYDNDGFIDVFLTSPKKGEIANLLLINQNGTGFIAAPPSTGVSTPWVSGATSGDLEGDGDIDIFGFRSGTNMLWGNDHNCQDFVLIHQTGPSGYNPNNASYAVFYEAGHLGEPSAILGRRQSRAGNSHPLAFNSSDIHFGMGKHKFVDVLTYSAHGQIEEYHHVAAGTTLELPEYEGYRQYFHSFANHLKQIVNIPRIAFGFLGLLLNILGQFYFISHVKRRFHWHEIFINMAGVINLIIYLFIFYQINYGEIWMTLVFPLAIAQSINIGIYLLYLLYQQLAARMFSTDNHSVLLQNVMIFAHGEWALKSINSLILYFQNYESASQSKLSNKILERVETFLELTLPAIHNLISHIPSTAKKIFSAKEMSAELELLENDLKSFQKNWGNWTGDARLLANHLEGLLNTIRILKRDIYAGYSSNPQFVIQQLIKSMEDDFKAQQITIELLFDAPESQMALISQSDLLAILDNCFRNACKALQQQSRKILRIRIFEFAPRLRIQIIDSGPGVSPEIADKIFEPGWSKSGSTGLGLFQAKEILKKYAATIYLDQNANPGLTTFTIDLHKGVEK